MIDREVRKRGRATPGHHLKDTPLGTGGFTDWMNNVHFQLSYRGERSGPEKVICQEFVIGP